MESKRNKQQSNRQETKSKISEKAPTGKRPPEGSQSIHRAIDLLHAIAKLQGKRSGLSRLAREVQLPNSTSHRILSVLVQRGLITRDPLSKNYHLGVELFSLGTEAQQFTIKDLLRPALERIAHESQDSVYLFVRSGNDGLCIDKIDGTYPIRIYDVGIGDRRVLGFGSGCLALLAFLPEDQIETIISSNKVKYHQHFHLTAKKIRLLVKKSRELTYALSEDVVIEGTTGVGLPFFNRIGQVVAAISVGGISRRLNENRREEIVELIRSEMAAYTEYST
jgi:DNA-binding IclR family transcriptional regulator